MSDFDQISSVLFNAGFEVRVENGAQSKYRVMDPCLIVCNLFTGENLRINFDKEGSLFSFFYEDIKIAETKGLFKGERYAKSESTII